MNRKFQQFGADRMAMIRLRNHREAVEKGYITKFAPVQAAKRGVAAAGDKMAEWKAKGQFNRLSQGGQEGLALPGGADQFAAQKVAERQAARDQKVLGQAGGTPAEPAPAAPGGSSGGLLERVENMQNPPTPAPPGAGPAAPPPAPGAPPAAPVDNTGGGDMNIDQGNRYQGGPSSRPSTGPPAISPTSATSDTSATPTPGPSGGGEAPQANAANQNQNRFNINVGTQGGGTSGGTSGGTGTATGPAGGADSAQQAARNAQVTAASERAGTSGGFGTGVVSNLLTGGLSGMARGAWNKYQRGQGKNQLQQYGAGNFTASFDDPNAATASADRILKASSHIHIRQEIFSKGRGMSRDQRRMISDAVSNRGKGIPIPDEPKVEDEAPGKMCACGKGMVPDNSYTGDRCPTCYDKKEAKRRGGA
tara:strand:- start:1130 stop:2392 length:1263 start_codon:yes stop_codon:yes gene_type:complete